MKRQSCDSEWFRVGAALAAMVAVFFFRFIVEPPRIFVLFIIIMLTVIITFMYKPSQEEENFTNFLVPENERFSSNYQDAEEHHTTKID